MVPVLSKNNLEKTPLKKKVKTKAFFPATTKNYQI